MSQHYLDAPTVTVLRQAQALGWQQNGDFLQHQSTGNNTNDPHFVSPEVLELAQIPFNIETQRAVKIVDFQVCSDGIRHSTEYTRKPGFSIMGMNIRFHLHSVNPVDIIMACTNKDWDPPAEVRATHTSPTFVTRFYKKTLTPNHETSTQVIKMINAYSGQQFALYLVGNKSKTVKVEDVKVESFPIPIEVSTEAYHGQLMVVFEKLFDIHTYNQQQAKYIIKYYNKIANSIQHSFGFIEAKSFVQYCQGKFCLACQQRSHPATPSVHEKQPQEQQAPQLVRQTSKLAIDKPPLSKTNSVSNVNKSNSKASSESHKIATKVQADSSTSSVLPPLRYCFHPQCIPKLIHHGDYRTVLDEQFVQDLIYRNNTQLEIEDMLLQRTLHRGKLRPKSAAHAKHSKSLEALPTFNITKWEYRDKVIEKKKYQVELSVEQQLYIDSGEMYKRICPRCKMVEPFLDARFHRLLKIAEEEKKQQCTLKGKPFIKSEYKAKCVKCRVPFEPRITWNAEIWENKTNRFVTGQTFRRETLANIFDAPMQSDKWKYSAFTNSPNPEVKVSLLHKELTEEGFRHIFKKKKKSKRKAVKILPDPIEIPDVSRSYNSREVCTPNSKVSVSSGFFVTSAGEMVFFDDEVDDDDEEDEDANNANNGDVMAGNNNESEEIQANIDDVHIQSKLSVHWSPSESITELEGVSNGDISGGVGVQNSTTMSLVLEKLKNAVVLDHQLSDMPEEVLQLQMADSVVPKKLMGEHPRQQPIPVFIPPF